MMPTLKAQTRIDAYMRKCVKVARPSWPCFHGRQARATVRDCTSVSAHTCVHASVHSHARAFTLIEMVVVILVLSLFVILTMMNLFGLLRKNTFKVQARQFVSTMQMAASAAAESERRYEVIIDLTEQCYTLRQITSPDLSQVLEEEIIVTNDFGANCQVFYVLFDDLMETDEDHQVAKFRAGHAGWQYGGKIVLLDEMEQPYSVVVSRMSRVVTLKKGDVEFMLPKAKDEVLF